MEDFECKAPMYVNFVESSALTENDGADTFFDFDENQAMCDTVKCESADDLAASGTVCTSVQSEHQETVHVENTFIDEQSELRNNTEDEPRERTPENAYDIINIAMKNLWTASKQKNPEAVVEKNVNILPQAKGQSLHCEEDCTQKMKATLTTKNGKPKFISMAEAIRQFQTSTPDRFHSKPKTAKFISSLQHRKDVLQVPYLALHLQSDPVHYMSSSKEGEPVEEVKTLQVNANPNVMELPKGDATAERKLTTASGSVKLADKVKKANLGTSEDVPKKKELTATERVLPSISKKSRVYAISLGVKDGVKTVTEKEVHYFGIPTARTVEQKRRTKVQPFSFEERDRQRRKKKEETIQKYLEQEKKTREFRANPVPASMKASNTQKQGSGLQKILTKGKTLHQGGHLKAVSTTVIQRETLKFKNTDHPFTDKNSAQ